MSRIPTPATIADAPQPDDADSDLYEHFGYDPRPLPTRSGHPMPLPKPPVDAAPKAEPAIEPDAEQDNETSENPT